MLKAVLTIIALALLWILMSGLFKPILLILGAVSVIITYLIIRRMNRIEGEELSFIIKPMAFLKYCVWLLKEIALANWAVTKVIVAPQMPIKQNLFSIPNTQQSDIGATIFANSITLTPGTITVETEPGYFLVHALSYSNDDLAALAEMDANVSAIEHGDEYSGKYGADNKISHGDENARNIETELPLLNTQDKFKD